MSLDIITEQLAKLTAEMSAIKGACATTSLPAASSKKAKANKSQKPGKGRRRSRKRRRTDGSVPIAQAKTVTGSAPKPIVTSGTDYIGTFTISPTDDDGSINLERHLNPLEFEGTHLSLLAESFEMFRFTFFNVIVETRVPSTVGGGYIVGIASDPTVPVKPGDDGKRRIRALQGSKSNPWWRSSRVKLDTADKTWRYTSRESTELIKTSAGKILFITDGPPSNITGSFTVSISMEYGIELTGPITLDTNQLSTEFDIPRDFTISTYSDGSYQYITGPFKDMWNYQSTGWNFMFAFDPPIEFQLGETKVTASYWTPSKTGAGSFIGCFFSTRAAAKAAGIEPSRGDVKIANNSKTTKAVQAYLVGKIDSTKPSLRSQNF